MAEENYSEELRSISTCVLSPSNREKEKEKNYAKEKKYNGFFCSSFSLNICKKCDTDFFEGGGWESSWIDEYFLLHNSSSSSPATDATLSDVIITMTNAEEEEEKEEKNAKRCSFIDRDNDEYMEDDSSIAEECLPFPASAFSSSLDVYYDNNEKNNKTKGKFHNAFKYLTVKYYKDKREKKKKKLEEYKHSFANGEATGEEKKQGTEKELTLCQKLRILFFSFLLITVTGAAIFNWVDLRVLLVRNGAYAEKCTEEEILTKGGCESQAVALNDAFNVGVVFIKIAGLFTGTLLDVVGPKVTAVLGLSLFASGIICLSCNAVSAGLILLGCAMNPIFNSTVSVANLFPKNKSFVICFLSAAGDLCVVDFLVMRIISDAAGDAVSPSVWLLGYLSVVFSQMIVVLFEFPRHSFGSAKSQKNKKKNVELERVTTDTCSSEEEKASTACRGSEEGAASESSNNDNNNNNTYAHTGCFDRKNTNNKLDNNEQTTPINSKNIFNNNNNNASNNNNDCNKDKTHTQQDVDGAAYSHLNRWECLKTYHFWVFLPFFVLLYFKKINYMRNVEEFVRTAAGSAAAESTVRGYITAYSSILCTASVFSLCVGFLADKIGLSLVVFIVNGFSCLFSLFSLIPSLELQILSFISFTIYKCFILSSVYCFVADVYGFGNIGFLTGTQQVIAGLFCLLNIPFQSHVIQGRWWMNHLILLILSVVMFLVPLYLYFYNPNNKNGNKKSKKKAGVATADIPSSVPVSFSSSSPLTSSSSSQDFSFSSSFRP